MANYTNLEIDFVERTLELISQYEVIMHKHEFDKQYNHTLLTNCLLGLIVMPKERAITYLPKDRINNTLKGQMGISHSYFNEDYTDLKSLIIAIRHSIAHFNISFVSDPDSVLIDKIIFEDQEKGYDYIIASFVPSELLSFIRYYANWFLSIVKKYRTEIYESS